MNQTWDAVTYDQQFSFVTRGGAPILARLGARPGERILDLGCGTGELTAQLAEAGAEVVGLDADPSMIARATARFPALRFVRADAEGPAWPAEVGTFDAVFSNAALHWMKPRPVLTGVRQVLRLGGRFVGEFGGQGNVAAVLAGLAHARATAGLPPRSSPWFFPSVATYARLLEEAGFEPRAVELYDRPTPIPDLADGALDWIRMFAGWAVEDLPAPRADAIMQAAAEHARPRLLREARWFIDYRRIRFEAVST